MNAAGLTFQWDVSEDQALQNMKRGRGLWRVLVGERC